MQTKNILLTLAAAVATSAAPAACPAKPPTPSQTGTASPAATTSSAPGGDANTFGVISLRSASVLHFAGWSAGTNGFYNLLADQGATCADGGNNNNVATFQLTADGQLELYNTAEKQVAYVDRSGMGQGKVGFTSGDAGQPRNSERTGWSISEADQLLFDGQGFVACPGYGTDGSAWAIWLAGLDNPGFNQNCTGVSTRVVRTTTPVSCQYKP